MADVVVVAVVVTASAVIVVRHLAPLSCHVRCSW